MHHLFPFLFSLSVTPFPPFRFRSIGASKIANPDQVAFALDHDVQNKSAKNLDKYSKIAAFAQEQDVAFYPAGRGIGHQVMIEEGYAFPQTLAVASDSHSNMYGGVGCVGTPVVRTDAAAIWATGQTWWQIPEQVKVELTGRLPPGVTGKDVIIALCGYFDQDQVLNSAIEFTGPGVASLSVDERLSIANMTTEWGALAGVFPVDDSTLSWYERLIRSMDKFQFGSAPLLSQTHPRLNMARLEALSNNLVRSDPDAFYSKVLHLDLSHLSPHVSGPNSVKVATPLTKLAQEQIAIHKAYLVSCVNSRQSDLRAAAEVIRGKKVAPGVEFYVAAASSNVQRASEEAGDWGDLLAAGAKPLPAGCGPCIGLGTGLLEDGQVGISATNRNYKGRMGSPKALAYLASPAVVAASAAAGKICGPADLDPSVAHLGPVFDWRTNAKRAEQPAEQADSAGAAQGGGAVLLPGFPTRFSGPFMFAPQDNLNTDALYPGKYTYQDDMTPERQAEVVMENYDVDFARVVAEVRSSYSQQPPAPEGVRKGVVLVGGYNFGTGSSREQAATALKYAGVPLVIAGSFGDIFKRNATNNGLICLECPALVDALTKQYAKGGARGAGVSDGKPTLKALDQTLDLSTADGRLERTLPDGSAISYKTNTGVAENVQDLFLAGGLEEWIRKRL